MSVENFIRALPKADLGLQFEGTIPQKALLMVADHNDKKAEKGYQSVERALKDPEYSKLPDLIQALSHWIEFPDDLTRLVYEIGVALSKQNVRYAEISVNPLLYIAQGMGFEKFIEAMWDGADRARRGWQVQLQWVLNVPRDDPRRSDEISRWAMSATGRKNGVIAIGLAGREEVQPASVFERAFRNLEKKEFPRVIHAGDSLGSEGLQDTLEHINPSRLLGAWGAADNAPVLERLSNDKITLAAYLTREMRVGRIEAYNEYPLRALLDAGVPVTLSAGMPEFYKTTTADEYIQAVEAELLTVDDVVEMTLNSVRYSLQSAESKAAMLSEFAAEIDRLREEHLA